MGVASGISLLLIVGCLCLAERKPEHLVVAWLVPLGQLALAHYVGHVVLGLFTLYSVGLLEDQRLMFSLGCTIVYCVFAVISSRLWSDRFTRGPLEGLMRRLCG